jgi:hypothetical protein
MISEESALREKTREWLTERYHNRFLLKPIILHDLQLTVSEYLRRNFTGNVILSIPRYNEMDVKPDILSIVRLEAEKLGLIIAECKMNVTIQDFRQTMDYARRCQSYEAYLVFYGKLSENVKDRIRMGDNTYYGLNKYGKVVLKKLIIVEYVGNKTFIVKRRF